MANLVLNPDGIKQLLGKGESANEADTQPDGELLSEYDRLEEEKLKLYRELPDKNDPMYKLHVKKLHAVQEKQAAMGRFRRAK